jgi:hypothetical protein
MDDKVKSNFFALLNASESLGIFAKEMIVG